MNDFKKLDSSEEISVELLVKYLQGMSESMANMTQDLLKIQKEFSIRMSEQMVHMSISMHAMSELLRKIDEESKASE